MIRIGKSTANPSSIFLGSKELTKVYLGGVLMWSKPNNCALPDGYKECEYVENSDKAYIDTDLLLSSGDSLTMTIEIACSGSNDGAYMGSNYYLQSFFQKSYAEIYQNNDVGRLSLPEGKFNAVLSYANNYETFQIGEKSIVVKTGSSTSMSVMIFGMGNANHVCWNTLNDSRKFVNAKIYSAKIEMNGTLVRDMIPACRETDGKYGLYDIVGGLFYASRNDGYELSGKVI